VDGLAGCLLSRPVSFHLREAPGPDAGRAGRGRLPWRWRSSGGRGDDRGGVAGLHRRLETDRCPPPSADNLAVASV